MNLPTKNGRLVGRYQLLRVVRGDAVVTAYVYLGLASKFKADQFQMIGGYVDDDGRGHCYHTVAELQEGASRLRGEPPRREQAPSDLRGALLNMVEERGRRRTKQSTFGRGGVLIRA